ncbi:MAG: sulfatase [Rhodopirellula sp. JB044]|uniref:sulfatase n=1 Tax=Rhodopirellula sp. JB044 TaxID=3342844 RepID=UPI00370C85FD
MNYLCRHILVMTYIVFCLAAITPTKTAAESRPRVIVILADDMGYADLGVTGCTEIRTPNIDQLSTDGVRFTAAYATASVCCPSRAGLLTGRYQQRFGHEFNNFSIPTKGFSADDMGLHPDERTIGNAFQDAGYTTMCIGKWHMGGGEKYDPANRGFDEVFAIESGNRSYRSYQNDVNQGKRIQLAGGNFLPEEDVTYITDDLTQAAVDFIDRHQDDPFFIYLSYTAPHTPMQAKDSDLDTYQSIADPRRRTYAAMMKSLDEGVGRLRATLKDKGLDQNTLIVFTSDNGGATNNGSDNGIYRGMKGSKWEGGIRVPFVMTWPEQLNAGQTYDKPISTLDILPTTLAAIGTTHQGKPLDGVNILPYLSGMPDASPHETLFWRRGVAAAIRSGDWKLLRVEGNPDLLFNLVDDPSEQTNRAEAHPELVQRLHAELAKWERELARPRWTEGKKWERNQVLKHQMKINTREQERKYP